jgi:hypothetical protein
VSFGQFILVSEEPHGKKAPSNPIWSILMDESRGGSFAVLFDQMYLNAPGLFSLVGLFSFVVTQKVTRNDHLEREELLIDRLFAQTEAKQPQGARFVFKSFCFSYDVFIPVGINLIRCTLQHDRAAIHTARKSLISKRKCDGWNGPDLALILTN